jgi:hypothetical protein
MRTAIRQVMGVFAKLDCKMVAKRLRDAASRRPPLAAKR